MDVLFIIILEAGEHKKTWVWSVGWLEQERSAGWWSASRAPLLGMSY